jgi:hypothetical protein
VDFIGQSKGGITFAALVILLSVMWLSAKNEWSELASHIWRTIGEGLVISLIAWLLVLMVHLVYEPFHLQDDMRARRDNALTELQTQRYVLDGCNSDLKAERVRTGLQQTDITSQQTLIASQQTMLNGQQNTLTAQQATLNSQQTTVNSCVIALGGGDTGPQKYLLWMDYVTPRQIGNMQRK